MLPEANTKADSVAYLDWGGVTDDSGVTYTLQIATDDDFTTPVLLEKAGLTQSEYTLTEEEKLESVGEDAPYYWRVRAVDGASNEGAWSATGAFHVGSSLSLPGWAKYTLIAVGGVAIGFLGFWLGRRSAYSSF